MTHSESPEWHPLRRKLLWLWLRFWWLRILHALRIYRPYPYRPCKPAELGGGESVGIGTVDDCMAFMQRQHDSGSTAWSNMCESLARQGYQLAAMYSSAELHGRAVPTSFRHSHEAPARGDLVLYLNGGYGHIVTCTGNGWDAWTNDYTGKGKVGIADVRDMASWCGADSWYVADAWWASNHYRMTHDGSGDVALTDDDILRIADAVWDHAMQAIWDGKSKSARTILLQAHFYALEGGLISTVPATATTKPGERTELGKVWDEAADDSGGSGGLVAHTHSIGTTGTSQPADDEAL